MKKGWFVLIVLMAFSCGSDQQRAVKRTTVYYDLVKLLDEQVSLLSRSNVALDKTLLADEESEQVRLSPPGEEDWKKELALFYTADINKLGLEEAYEVEKMANPDGGYRIINTAKDDDQPVRSITYHFDATSKPVSFTILMKDENMVYTFDKEMTMQFEPFEEGVKLKSYKISGVQQMILKGELSFAIEGKVIDQ